DQQFTRARLDVSGRSQIAPQAFAKASRGRRRRFLGGQLLALADESAQRSGHAGRQQRGQRQRRRHLQQRECATLYRPSHGVPPGARLAASERAGISQLVTGGASTGEPTSNSANSTALSGKPPSVGRATGRVRQRNPISASFPSARRGGPEGVAYQ